MSLQAPSEHRPPLVTTQPRTAAWIDAAVEAGGARVVEPAEATAVVWTRADDPDGLAAFLAEHPAIDWVQLPWAGIDPYRGIVDRERTWSCAKGVYSDPVAEHAFAMLLAGFRQLHRFARERTWTSDAGRNLFGARVTILGGGGIAEVLIRLLAPFDCAITVVRTTPVPMDGVDRVLAPADLHEALAGADAVVLALPLVDATRQVIGAEELRLLAPGAWLVSVARGEHVDTDALVEVLEAGHLGGAALDVTDPEPLPDGHPLWSHPDVLITPHTGNTAEMARPLLSARITTNVARYAAGEPLEGLVDPDLGY
ncbi:MAG TPA: D-isomer specific 2-hydroxyacid dehydrogenase family protein [Aquihabitans sp.]|jgi:phosphoglycerate dehydrogenase-like enzyme|nr:D-isomer specific 2-hydroxyacid dehydrogenase family protein [Aquihabitans sp.]